MVVGAGAAGQDEQPQPSATFRSEINYVQIPVRVLDARGEFVSGLEQSDFQIREDGKPQTISAFTEIDIPFIPPNATVPAAPVREVEAFATNETPEIDGRAYLFVVDALNTETGDTHKVRRLLHDFIDERLAANDLAAISLMGGARSQGFTRNRTLLHEAVDRFIGDYDEYLPDRNHQALTTIARMAEWLGAIKDRRKALVLVSTSQVCSLASDDCRDSLQHALRAAMRADVVIYTIDPRGLVPSSRSNAEHANPNSSYGDAGYSELGSRAAFAAAAGSARGVADGARYLAEESGGIAVVNTNSLDRGMDRIVRDSSSYYLIGYHSTNDRADGRFRRNDVTVTRRDARVVHRNGYFAARRADVDKHADPAGDSVMAQLRELARSPVPISAMPMRVAAAPFLSDAGRSRVAVIVEIPYEGLRPSIDDGRYILNLGLSVGFYERNGKSIAGDDPNIELDIPATAAPKVTRNGLRIVSRINVPKGTYRLWVGAVQPKTGVRGSVMTEIDVPEFNRQPLELSGIIASTNDARRIYTARTDELLNDILGGPPIAHREFTVDNELWLYGEIYDHRSNGGDVAVTAKVMAANGELAFETPMEAAPVQFGHLARIPLKEIGRGDFTAVIEAASTSPGPVSATRTIRFSVK